MRTFGKLIAAGAALLGMGGIAAAQSKVTLAIGGASCLCYLPTVLTKQLGNFKKAGVDVDLVNFKGGSQALTAVIGGSADVVSGYFDHTVELAAKNQHLQAFVVYDRFPGLVLVVAPGESDKIKSIKDLKGKKVGVSAPGSSTDFFLKYELKKNGLPTDSASVVGVGLGGTAIAAMEQGRIDAAVMLDPAVTILQSKYKNLRILTDTRSQKDTQAAFGGDYPGGAFYTRASWLKDHPKEAQAMADAVVNTLELDPLALGRGHHEQDAEGDGRQGQEGLSRGPEEHDPDVFEGRNDGPERRQGGARGLQRRLARCRQGQYRRLEDLHKQFVKKAGQVASVARRTQRREGRPFRRPFPMSIAPQSLRRRRRSSRSSEAEPGLQVLPAPVHGVGAREIGNADMSVADRQLAFRGGFAGLADRRHVEGRDEAAAVGAALAVHQDRLLRGLYDADQLLGPLLRQQVARRHAKIDVIDAELVAIPSARRDTTRPRDLRRAG